MISMIIFELITYSMFLRAVVLVKNDGDLHATPLSDDHKPENQLEKARIEDAGGFVAMDR